MVVFVLDERRVNRPEPLQDAMLMSEMHGTGHRIRAERGRAEVSMPA
jgi:hypothetical protein